MHWIGHLERMWNASCPEGDVPRGERCSCWETDRFSANHETLHLLWKMTVHWPPSYSLSSVHIWARWTQSTLSQFVRFWDWFSLKFYVRFWYFPCVVRSSLVSIFLFLLCPSIVLNTRCITSSPPGIWMKNVVVWSSICELLWPVVMSRNRSTAIVKLKALLLCDAYLC